MPAPKSAAQTAVKKETTDVHVLVLVVDKLVDALAAASNGTYDVEVLKAEIREAIDSAGGA